MQRDRIRMGTLVLLLPLAILAPRPERARADTPSPEAARRPFVGTWKLVAYETFRAGGEAVSLDYIGRITYDAQGNMAAQLMRRDRPAIDARARATPEQIQAAYRTYIAYFGAYDVDTDKKIVTHHVEGALYPNWVGTDLVRSYEFSEGRLKLSVRSGDRPVLVLSWEKMG